MGMTHYMRRPEELAADAFARAAADCRKLLKDFQPALTGFERGDAPQFHEQAIIFNGGCEPLNVRRVHHDLRGRPEFFIYCKTERLPYDQAVKMAMIVLKHHLGDAVHVTSDADDGEWESARLAVQERLGYGGDFKLDGKT